ncbi:YihY/virulence factor BrkB family protein [Parasphingorhabdus cellanae]|uniref:YihY/virulence factor BrkB family protein n=1 Tax=Parasphingorhabdus cellanae TaxID=2806553 RepID=A0ABX7T5L3_9SPHN|nr:YihY/virulence factor BrkB family protein [Parasphingorhabdus cellanae]QTD55802.1 YihY/virulence factor BrkB family protein [Parasphingorhabdus cellanae]
MTVSTDPSDVTTAGASSKTPLHFPLKAWWAILKRIYVMNDFHNLPLLAAGVAFFGFLAFVPLIAVVIMLYGLVADTSNVANVIDNVDGLLPREVVFIIREQLLAVVKTSKTAQGFGLALALLISTYGAMRAATAIIKALNIIYEERESRNIFATTFIAAKITLGMALVAIVGLSSISFFSYASNFLQGYLGDFTLTLIKVVTWITAGFLVSVAFGLFYRFGPDRRPAKWRWLTLGSAVATLLWLLITLGFGFYAANISNYNATYGSLAAVVIFLMWLFLSAYAVLLGAEINAETERQTFEDSTTGPDRPIGQRGAVMADTVLLDEASKHILAKKQRRRADRLARKTSKRVN